MDSFRRGLSARCPQAGAEAVSSDERSGYIERAPDVSQIGLGMRVSPTLTVAAAVFALAAGTVGCSEEPEPILADPTPSASPTETPSPTKTTEPWEERSVAGAEAFAERYVEIWHQTMTTGETQEYRALGPECEFCNDSADQVDEVYDAGGSITSDPFKVAGIVVQERPLAKRPTVSLAYKHDGITWIRKAGQEPDVYPPAETEELMYLEWNGSEWSIDALVDIPDDL